MDERAKGWKHSPAGWPKDWKRQSAWGAQGMRLNYVLRELPGYLAARGVDPALYLERLRALEEQAQEPQAADSE